MNEQRMSALRRRRHLANPERLELVTLETEELDELRYLWLSRLMFNPFVGWPPEKRSFEEFVRDCGPGALTEGGELRGFREGGSGLDGNAGLPPSSVSASGPKEGEDGCRETRR